MVVVTLLVGGAAAAPMQTATAASNGEWSIFPYRAPAANGSGRSLFDFSLKAGESISDAFTLSNETTHSLEFSIYPADAYDAPAGDGFALRGFGQRNVGVGKWVRLPKSVSSNYTLAARTKVTVPFIVSVPADAAPGDHAGGIVALDVTPVPGTNSHDRVTVHEGVGVRVYVHVLGGPVRPHLAVSDIQANTSVPPLAFLTGSSRADVRFDVVNTGNTIFDKVKAEAYATDLFGTRVETFRPQYLAAVLPGAHDIVTEPEWRTLPVAGPVTIHVQLVAQGVDQRDTSSFWVVPWLLIVLVVAVLALLALYLWRRHRRQRRSRSAPDPIGDVGEREPSPASGHRVAT